MSGGRYAPAKAPERACLTLDRWPADDAARWRAACAPGSLLDETAGERARYSAVTNEKDRKGYGRWLNHLGFHEPEALALPAGARITQARVEAYVARLEALAARPATILARLQELVAIVRIIAPDCDWALINRVAARVRARRSPERDKAVPVGSDDLLALGLALMDQAEEEGGLEGALRHRDGLMIAFLALLPLRRRNLADLVLGRSLVRHGETFVITFAGAETKTGEPLEFLWPQPLVKSLRRHLDHWRPLLAAREGRWTRPHGDALWLSKDGSPLTQIALYDRIRARTREAFGQALNPHAFRHAAATMQAERDPARAHLAAPLLGHADYATTERHYLHAQAAAVHRDFLAVLEDIKGERHD